MEPGSMEVPVKVFRESFKMLQVEMRAIALTKQIKTFHGMGLSASKTG